MRLAIINAVLRDVATKHDIERLEEKIERLREEFKRELDVRIGALDKRIDALDKRIDFAAKVTLALTGTVLAALTAAVIKLAITP